MHSLTKTLKLLKVGDVAIRRNPLFYSQAREQLAALAAADFATRQQWTITRLAEILWLAQRTAYGQHVKGSRHLEQWPLLDKALVRAEPQSLHAGGAWLTVKASTGGTSGTPLRLIRSLRSVAFEQACIDTMIERLGADPRTARIAVLRGDNVKDPADFRPPYWRFVAGGQRLILSSNHLNAVTAPLYAQALETFAPAVLWAYPTAIEALCVNLVRAGRALRVPRVLTSSEVLGSKVWQLIEQTLGSQIVDYYGQAERVAFAFATDNGAYRFLPGYAYVELERRAVEGSEILYEIIGTSLWNTAMPLIRYRTGDHLRLPAAYGAQELAEITLGMRTFGGVLGRDSDVLISPEGVRLTGIDHFQRDVANIVRIQVIQESLQDVRILVLAEQRYSRVDGEQLLKNVRTKLPASMNVHLECVEALERTALGKTPFVIHRPAVQACLPTAKVNEGSL